MRTTLVLLTCLFLYKAADVNAQSNISGLDKDQIRESRINSITEWNHPVIDNRPAENGTISLKAVYDDNGYQVEEITYNSRGEESRRVTSRFDNNGNRIEYQVFDSRSNRVTFSRMTRFDANGNRIAEWGFDGIRDYRNIYHLNSDRKPEEIHYTAGGNLREKRIFSYDGNETNISVVLPDNTVTEKIRLISDNAGNLLAESYYDKDGNLVRKVEYTYENGLKKGERHFQGDQMQYRDIFTYDDGMLTMVSRVNRQGHETVTHRYTYDDRGRLVNESWYNENSDNYSSRDYTYDSLGNMKSVTSYYATYSFRVQYRYDYSFFN